MKFPVRARLLVLIAASMAPEALLGQSSGSSLIGGPVPAIDAPSAITRPETSTTITVSADSRVESEAIHVEAEREVKEEETQRIAVVVPNFYTVIDGAGVPLDKTQKTELAWRATTDPFNLVGAFVLGGVSELTGSHRGFGWGPGGYAKRVGANYADVADSTMLAGAVYPILLHQDPRFFRRGIGSFQSRLRHALLAPYICRGDNGRAQPNLSNLLGNLTAGAISNAYYPGNDTGVSLTLANSAVVMAEGSLGNFALEFAPDVQGWLQRRKSGSATRAAKSVRAGTHQAGTPEALAR